MSPNAVGCGVRFALEEVEKGPGGADSEGTSGPAALGVKVGAPQLQAEAAGFPDSHNHGMRDKDTLHFPSLLSLTVFKKIFK